MAAGVEDADLIVSTVRKYREMDAGTLLAVVFKSLHNNTVMELHFLHLELVLPFQLTQSRNSLTDIPRSPEVYL